jgi:two-component system, LytTR family, sensor kinase
LDLEKIRFGNRLIFSINLAPPTNNTLIPPAMVLTLVENAIKHGITQLPEGGEISIRSWLKEDKLMLQVKNTGQYHVKRLNGIGLKNIQNRLRFLYGENASFHISNLDEKCVMASICCPLEIEKKEEHTNVGEPFTLEQI